MQQNNQKNRIIIILIVCAVACSVLAGFLIWNYMTPSRTAIYVFNGDYNEGDAVTADILTPVMIDSTILVNGTSSSADTQLVTSSQYSEIIRSGQYLRMDVSAGMPLTTGMLSVQGGSTLEMNMTSDSIAVSFSVDQFSGVTNSLKAGSRVNIYSIIGGEVRLIQQNKRVLEVFGSSGSISGIAVEESLYESMELIYAIKNGSIYLGLVDASGYQASEGSDPVYSSSALSQTYIAEASSDSSNSSGSSSSANTAVSDYDDEFDTADDIATDDAAQGLGLDLLDGIDIVEEGTETE